MSTTWDEFDWFDDESVVIREQPPIAVYSNTHGTVVIRQDDGPHDPDLYILIQPRNVLDSARAMLAEVGLEHMLIEGARRPAQLALPAHEPKDPKAAERQRRRRARERDTSHDVTRDDRDTERDSQPDLLNGTERSEAQSDQDGRAPVEQNSTDPGPGQASGAPRGAGLGRSPAPLKQ